MTTNNESLTDAAARFSLLEMDGPVRPAAPIAVPTPPAPAPTPVVAAPAPAADGTCSCGATRPLAVRGVCPRCQGRVARPAPTSRTAPIAQLPVELAARREESQAAKGALVAGDLVAGAIAEGHGVLVSWSGRGELSLSQIREAVAAAGAPADWAPKTRSTHAQAGHAVEVLNGRGFVVRATRNVKGETMETRGWRARWTVGVVAHQGAVGDALGRRVLQVTLTAQDTLEIDGDNELAAQVREEFRRRTGAESFGSAEVTDWLRGCLLGRLGGVKLGGSFYIPRASVDAGVALCTEVSKVWGAEWMLPALPIATSAQLRTSLANGLATEAQDVLDELAAARAAAAKDGKPEIGGRAAATLLAKLVKVQDRAGAYAALLGEAETARVRAAILAAVETVRPLVSDTTQRGNLIWDEVAGAR